VLSPRTIQSLMNLPVYQWRIDGASIVSWATGSNNPVDLLGRLTALATVVDGVPQFVWHDHGVATAPPVAPAPPIAAPPAPQSAALAPPTGSSAGPKP